MTRCWAGDRGAWLSPEEPVALVAALPIIAVSRWQLRLGRGKVRDVESMHTEAPYARVSVELVTGVLDETRRAQRMAAARIVLVAAIDIRGPRTTDEKALATRHGRIIQRWVLTCIPQR